MVDTYRSYFKQTPTMHLSHQASRADIIRALLKTFNWRWHPWEDKEQFIETFSIEKWNRLTTTQRDAESTVLNLLLHSLPIRRKQRQRQLPYHPRTWCNSAPWSHSVLHQLDIISQQHLGKTAQDVSTPRTQLFKNPGRTQHQESVGKIVKNVKQCIQDTMDKTSLTLVMANRMSWTTFDKMRKTSLITPERETRFEECKGTTHRGTSVRVGHLKACSSM